MNREEFIRRWRDKLAGMIALGGAEVRRSLSGAVMSDETIGRALTNIATAVDVTLGAMFDSLNPPKPPAVITTPANGQQLKKEGVK
jgi:hypothetical protein